MTLYWGLEQIAASMEFVVQVEVHPKGWVVQMEQLEIKLHARRLTSETN